MIIETTTGFFTKISCDLNVILELLDDPKNDSKVIESVSNLKTNIGHYKRAKEAIAIGRTHSEETRLESLKEAAAIHSSSNLIEKIILT